MKKTATTIKPLVCMCEINGMVGVVLRQDYDEASSDFWRETRVGQKKRSHADSLGTVILKVPMTFVFGKRSNEIEEIKQNCHVERATFEVPFMRTPPRLRSSRIALEYFLRSTSADLDLTAKPAFLVGTHQYSFRRGDPARIIGFTFGTPEGCKPRLCYRIRFRDGFIDSVPVSDSKNFAIISEDDVNKGNIPKVIY